MQLHLHTDAYMLWHNICNSILVLNNSSSKDWQSFVMMKTINSFPLGKVIAVMSRSHYRDEVVCFLNNKGKSTKEAIALIQEYKHLVISPNEEEEIMFAIFNAFRED